MSSTMSVLPETDSVKLVFKTLKIETTALLEYLERLFLMDYPVFAPNLSGRTRVHEPLELLNGLLHCIYHDICSSPPMSPAPPPRYANSSAPPPEKRTAPGSSPEVLGPLHL